MENQQAIYIVINSHSLKKSHIGQRHKIFFLIWPVVVFACNLPAPVFYRQDISSRDLRETLQAQDFGSTLTPSTPETLPENLFGEEPSQTQDSFSWSAPEPVPIPSTGYWEYTTQSGDTLQALTLRFEIEPTDIIATPDLPTTGLIPAGLPLLIPNSIGNPPYAAALLPDSEVVFSPAAQEFDIAGYVQEQDGFLSTYQEQVDGETISGAEIISLVAADFSINPRLLLTFLEYRSGWVLAESSERSAEDYPLGFRVPGYRGLYYELGFAASKLNIGYYGWRSGELTELTFQDQRKVRINPILNAGSVAVQYLFAKLYDQASWEDILYEERGIWELYQEMFGDPWSNYVQNQPIFPIDIAPPALELPFAPGERWSFSGGPHYAWNTGTPRGGLDFAPVTGEPPCVTSRAWATAAAAGLIVRSGRNVVVLDLDSDGFEQTGWVVLYLHIADEDRIAEGVMVSVDQQIGHPSCERGNSTGTHVHIARKYNGEWIPAGDPLPFSLSGWKIEVGERNYAGQLVKGDQIVAANPLGTQSTIIIR